MKIKLFDVLYCDRLHRPRGLVVEIFPTYLILITEGGGTDYVNLPPGKWRLMDLAEWERFAEHLRDDIVPREFRELVEKARAPIEWPKCWNEFKERYEATGNAFIDEPQPGRLTEWPPAEPAQVSGAEPQEAGTARPHRNNIVLS